MESLKSKNFHIRSMKSVEELVKREEIRKKQSETQDDFQNSNLFSKEQTVPTSSKRSENNDVTHFFRSRLQSHSTSNIEKAVKPK